jgi:hypothetical protein
MDTPPGGVATDKAIVRGTIDRRGSVPASIRIAVQHEYTKDIRFVDTSSPALEKCWEDDRPAVPFCIDADGRFSAEVPLERQGPYTISMSASRVSGESVEKKVRMSRVSAVKLSPSSVTFDPDIQTTPEIDAPMVTVTIGLLGDCSFCDFIGASTGGVTATVVNEIVEKNGEVKTISCDTTVEQGGQGRFVIGVPAMPGKNSITVKACNAATGGDCPSVGAVNFTAKGEVAAFQIISPPPMPSYSSDEYPEIDMAFKTGGGISCLDMQFNREEVREVCADDGGVFHANLEPRVGINIATFNTKDGGEAFAWTFGWGKLVSPFKSPGGSVAIDDAAGIFLSNHLIGEILIPFVNNFIASDEFYNFIAELFLKATASDAGDGGEAASEAEAPNIIPGCDAGGSQGEYAIGIGGMPEFKSLELADYSIGDGKINLAAAVKELRATITVAPDKDGDGKADKDPLPIVLSFAEAKIVFSVEMMGEAEPKLLLISSPYTDCSYKGSYCKDTPASLVPDNFKGDATPSGNFIRCDESKAKGDAVEPCKALNSLNAQTGVVGEMILDAINDIIYCKGSGAASGLLRDYGVMGVPIGCKEGGQCEGMMDKVLPAMSLPLGVKLSDVSIKSNGVSIGASASAGSNEFFKDTPDAYKIESAGVIVGDEERDISPMLDYSHDFSLGLSLNGVDALLYAAVAHGDGRGVRGLMDFDIHEPFFNMLGYDFVKECDGFEPIPGVKDKPPTLCYIRPRVMELLGSALTSYGYFPPKQPVMMAIRGNRALAPRISVVSLERLPVVPREKTVDDNGGNEDIPTGSLAELEIGGATISFYALEVDKDAPEDAYGNLPVKLDASGRPVIRSMRPDSASPWDGQIVSFDMTLLLGIEIGDIKPDEESENGYSMNLRLLADRSRLVLTPIEGSNSTTIPARRLISSLADQVMTAISQMSQKESPTVIPIPAEIAIAASENEGGPFGLSKISIGPDGLSLRFDDESDVISIAVTAAIEQLLHKAGEPVTYHLP